MGNLGIIFFIISYFLMHYNGISDIY